MKHLLLLVVTTCIVGGCNKSDINRTAPEHTEKLVSVVALVETTPVTNNDDAADDPAIWIHPTSPEKSLILGTNKRNGLEVYDLDGERLQILPTGRLNNIDVRQNVKWGDKEIDIAVGTNRTTKSLDLFQINSASGKVTHMQKDSIALTLDDPYGVCLYHNSNTDKLYAFANDKDGRYQQWLLQEKPELVRSFSLKSQPEGCVADDDNDVVYIGEENKGMWRIDAEQTRPFNPILVDTVGNERLTADVEGISLYKTDETNGFLIVSSQGNNTYAAYERQGKNNYIGSFQIVKNEALNIDGASETDGLDVTNHNLGEKFPEGMLVVQDGVNTNPDSNQNFKYISWKDVQAAIGIK